MNWTSSFLDAIDYIESHLLDDIDNKKIANEVAISSFYFQKSFLVYTGYTVNEYIRSRRLYKAALELQSSNTKIIDIAYKYGYETPESFTKAFTRFHGYTPSQIKKNEGRIKLFLPLKISISIKGGNEMDYTITEEKELVFVGFKTTIKDGEGYKKCPMFWDEISDKYFSKINDNSDISNAIKMFNIGSYAICVNNSNDSFDYYICGRYLKGDIPQGLEKVTFKSSLWAKFRCIGPIPGSLQSVNSKIWNEWIPNNHEYELGFEADVEYYSNGDIHSDNYESEIWLPVKKK